MFTHMMTLAGVYFGKFSGAESKILPRLRTSFFFYSHAHKFQGFPLASETESRYLFSRGWWPYMEHFNIIPSCSTGLPLYHYHPNTTLNPNATAFSDPDLGLLSLNETESSRPDVFVWNSAMAYAAQDLTWNEFQKFVRDVKTYFDDGNLVQNNKENIISKLPYVLNSEKRKEISGILSEEGQEMASNCLNITDITEEKKNIMQTVWYTPPFIYSQAHAGSPWLTSHRVTKYHHYSMKEFSRIGFKIADAYQILQSRWEESHDGLHYMKPRIGTHAGLGTASAMAAQATLNSIFPTCSLFPKSDE
eukprot:c27490_g1_i1.p1 GENE.c27490_g1_i1~~c27490_g1_i1.p1  ORF type:complete len:305 (-),score=84.55 c27490_g1_i1:86-1000(-)